MPADAVIVTAPDPAFTPRMYVEMVAPSAAAMPAVIVTVAAAVTTNDPPAVMAGEPFAIFFSELTVTVWSMETVKLLVYTSSVVPGSVPPSHVDVEDQRPEATAYRIATDASYE
jgi:hypothetical protein